jgi:hypothetical protein
VGDDAAVGWIEQRDAGGDAGARPAAATGDRGEQRRGSGGEQHGRREGAFVRSGAPRRAARRARHRRKCRVLAQDRALERAELHARFETEFLDEPHARVAIGRERLLLAPGAIQGEHLLAAELLTQRVLAREGPELGDQDVLPAECQIRVDPRFDRAQAELLEPLEFEPRAAVEIDILQRAPTPQAFGFAQPLARESRNTGRAAGVQQGQESVRVQLTRLDPQQITGCAREQTRFAQHLAQARDLVGERVARGAGRLVVAELFEQSFARYGTVGVQQQDGKQGALSWPADRERPAVRSYLERPQDQEFHRPASISESSPARR